jgi:hypothetical protein
MRALHRGSLWELIADELCRNDYELDVYGSSGANRDRGDHEQTRHMLASMGAFSFSAT